MTAIVELIHNGASWVLNVTPEDGEGLEVIEIPVTDAKKDELVAQGCEIYED
jgi:hypothetical protein